MLQFRTVLLFAVVINVLSAILMTDAELTEVAAVFWKLRLRLVPGVEGLSPSIVTLSAPLSSRRPRPVVVGPATVIPSVPGCSRMDE